jgi:hypothetical protein
MGVEGGGNAMTAPFLSGYLKCRVILGAVSRCIFPLIAVFYINAMGCCNIFLL